MVVVSKLSWHGIRVTLFSFCIVFFKKVDEPEVQSVLNDRYPIAQKRSEMSKKKGATSDEVDDWETLGCEMIQAVQSKQLVPTMRTQYTRTAFQIPFDATVRISLDTNLCLILLTFRCNSCVMIACQKIVISRNLMNLTKSIF